MQRVFLVLTEVHTEWVVRCNVFEVLSLRKMAHHLLLMREELPWFASVDPPNHDRPLKTFELLYYQHRTLIVDLV